MSIRGTINNDLIQEESSVWLLKQHDEFDYSDGVESEIYLESVFRNAKDLSSNSSELESYIKDWPSEYHLTVKRAQLFAGFDFNPSLKVLEVGCGCGAITRYLGETFNDVVSIEGSIKRARLARLRTKGMDSISIICAPFQEISFSRKFDVVFCVGVYEYSASFVDGEDPYNAVLSYFSEILTPNGFVVIAIENQFGLKYLNSSREDHTGIKYEGLEGYHRYSNKVKTFGKYELEDNLKKYFTNIKFYYPYPDYKLPDCIISDKFLSNSLAGELVSQIRSRDYYGETKSLWDESIVTLELTKNRILPFFSNSFLVFAGKSEIVEASFDQLAVIVSSQRTKKFKTQTRIYSNKNREISVSKKLLSGEEKATSGNLTLAESSSIWQDSYSLQTLLYENCMSKEKSLIDIFMPCRIWVNHLSDVAVYDNGEKYLGGEYIDCVFSNIYLDSPGISIIDNEWIWSKRIKFNTVVIRSIYTFLRRIEDRGDITKLLKARSLKKLILLVAESMGVKLGRADFLDFIKLESEFQFLVHDAGKNRMAIMLQLILFDRPTFHGLRKIKKISGKINQYNKRLIAYMIRK